MIKALIAVVLGLVIAIGWPGVSPSAASNLCQEVRGQQLCLETIKRSAKYPWEYRVVISVDGKRRPLSRYDCRQPLHYADRETDPETETTLAEAALSEVAVQQFICDLVSR